MPPLSRAAAAIRQLDKVMIGAIFVEQCSVMLTKHSPLCIGSRLQRSKCCCQADSSDRNCIENARKQIRFNFNYTENQFDDERTLRLKRQIK